MEARPQEVLGDLSGLAAACVPRYEHHLVRADSADYVGPVLVDGEGLLVSPDLGKLLKLQGEGE